MDRSGEFYKGFSEVSKKEWLQKIETDLKGKPFEDLLWELEEGISLQPIHHPDDLKELPETLGLDRQNNDWEIGAYFLSKDPKESNKQLLEGLMGGLNAIHISFDQAPAEADFTHLLRDIEPNFISTHLQISNNISESFAVFKDYIIQNYSSEYLQNLRGSICFEPDGTSESDIELAQQLYNSYSELAPKFKLIQLSTPAFTEVQNITDDLAQVLHKAQNIFNTLGQKISPDLINRHLKLRLEVGTNFFAELAKLRAIRILWANLINAYGAENRTLEIEVHFAKNSLTGDANMNMIKASTQAMSAVLGGAQRLYIPPSGSEKGGLDFQTRIARNVQHLLKMESYLDRVVDPAAGSYYIEALTEKVATAAWEKFQKL